MTISLDGGSLVWIRRDLRLADNRALEKALFFRKKIALCFVFDKAILTPLKESNWIAQDKKNLILDRRVSFIYHSLKEISLELEKWQSKLFIFYDLSTNLIPNFSKRINASRVIIGEDYEPEAIRRDSLIAEKLKSLNIDLIAVKDHCIFHKLEVTTNADCPYTVFTPYKKRWLQRFSETPCSLSNYSTEDLRSSLIKIDCHENFSEAPSLNSMGFSEEGLDNSVLNPGSVAGIKQLEQFKPDMQSYKLKRDYPSLNGVSFLSTHLRFGTISIRQAVLSAFNQMKDIQLDNIMLENINCWLAELIWREFYIQILYNFPHVVSGNFRKEYDNLKWAWSEEHFVKWCDGKTGYPIVDAGMRQLNKTGYMHNRLRMITASFLTKDLGINWRKGEQYFAFKLNDFELASNNGGWQWAASTGCDSQPYFRIFNPTTQSKKFDLNGNFIKKYVPELRDLDKQFIHEPFGTKGKNDFFTNSDTLKFYPCPIVDHSEARIKTLYRFKESREKT